MSTRVIPRHTATAALVYWLLVMFGLLGLSVLRASTPREYVPLWIGSVAGVGLGQLLGWLRLRVWLIAILSIVAVGVSPVLFALIYAMFGTFNVGLETCLMAFIPAAVCGYLSLSERSGLVAFWYPAMLWMLVILDRPATGPFDAERALPLVLALGALFVAFLRSRETRRSTIWTTYSTERLAEPRSRTVLRTSPLRGASQHLWTAFVGGGALLLTVWVAPHLWKKDVARHSTVTPVVAPSSEAGDLGGERCCASDEIDEQRRERVKEYLPLKHGNDESHRYAPPSACTRCQSGRARVASGGATGAYATGASQRRLKAGVYWDGDPFAMSAGAGTAGYGDGNTYNYNYGGSYGGGYVPPAAPDPTPPTPLAPLVPPPIPEPVALAPIAPLAPVAPLAPAPAKVATAPKPPLPSDAPSPSAETVTPPPNVPTVVFVAPPPAAPVGSAGTPWRAALGLCFGGIALHLAMRVLRRSLTLRHLARPFWRETLDQRVSNHWQRMLIGLRDAGIHAKDGEQPQALAKRVGIAGMETCATILERVRHGVRVEAGDLEAMDAAAGAVYHAAREKAGAVACAAALVRSPL